MKHIPKSNCANYTDVAHQCRTIFGSGDVEKVQAVVARSACPNQNAESTMLVPLLEVDMSKKCTLLWHEAHFQVKSAKNTGTEHFWIFLDVQMPFRVAGARDCAPCQK